MLTTFIEHEHGNQNSPAIQCEYDRGCKSGGSLKPEAEDAELIIVARRLNDVYCERYGSRTCIIWRVYETWDYI